MTPDDVAAIRSKHTWSAQEIGGCAEGCFGWPCDPVFLADALDAAWAERDQERRESEALDAIFEADVIALRERAEKAEAQLAEMRHACQNLLGCPAPMWRERAERADAEIAHLHSVISTWQRAHNRDCLAEAALARVRALCDELDIYECSACARVEQGIRAAIEGDQQ